MGAVYRFNLNEFIEKYGVKVFVETGTGDATSFKDSFKYPFEKTYSIEYNKEMYDRLSQQNNFPEHAEVINDDSVNGLKKIFEVVSKETPIIFYLDAHFANSADFHLGTYSECKDNKELHLPLESELKCIKEFRKDSVNVIICDDVRIYMDGEFGGGNWQPRKELNAGTIDFAYELFSETHDISIDYRDQGYLILLPKNI